MPCFYPVFCSLRFEPFLCEGTLRHRNTREFYSSASRAFGPSHAQLCTSVEEETEQKIDNKTRHGGKNKANK